MAIAENLIKQILADVLTRRSEKPIAADAAPDDGLLQLAIVDNAQELEGFYERAPDSGESFPEVPSSLAVLGTYQWMASPGIIGLDHKSAHPLHAATGVR